MAPSLVEYCISMEQEQKKFLIVIDGSYFNYVNLFASTKTFTERYPEDAATWIKPADECDQKNLPNLLNCDNYKKCLKQQVMWKLESVEEVAKANFQSEIDECGAIDIVFAMDDKLSHSFRKALYPEYKAHRALVKRQFQLQPIKDYIADVIFKELDVEGERGYHLVKVDGAEGDDVIATTILHLRDKYVGVMLVASDHDFLQIDGIREFDLFGKEAKRDLGGEIVSAQDYLVGKILMGDRSDNIQQVFTRCGPKTALKWTKDKEALKKTLKEDHSLAARYMLNRKMIDFKCIPQELSDKILKTVNESLYRDNPLNKRAANDWSDFMTL